MRPTFRNTTAEYETWLRGQTEVDPKGLELKHTRMSDSAFAFLRATFYRWAQQFPIVCPEISGAPHVLGVGDVHLENYGLWRDAEGRLAWGINDFDEAARLPYTNDLVRLVCSAGLSPDPPAMGHAAADVLRGYRRTLSRGGIAFVLADRHRELHKLAMRQLEAPAKFWSKLAALHIARHVPADIGAALTDSLPKNATAISLRQRYPGLGSLGRPRATVIAMWNDALVGREAKRVIPSAWQWASGDTATIEYARVIKQAVRAPDPFLSVDNGWVFRRISPDNSKIEMAALGNAADRHRLLRRMGAELGNVHCRDERIEEVREHAQRLTVDTLAHAALAMKAMIQHDLAEHRTSMPR